jgi:hypothetical protein
MAGFQRANPYLDEIVDILQNHLERHGGDTDKARQSLSKADNEWIDSEFVHCMADARYFLSNYYAIKTEDKGYTGLYPFWDSQEMLHDEFRNLEKKYGFVKAMVNKARQMGGSTYVSGEIFHKTIFSEHVNTLVVAQDADQSGFIFDMYRSALDFLPWWMRPRIRYQQAGTFIDFDEKDETLRSIRPGLKTRIYVDNGNKPTGAGRGKSFVYGHLDELAFWDKPSQLTKSLLPTMNAKNGFYVMISTPNGRNDAWHNLWRRAEAGKFEYRPIYIPYYRRDKTYSLPIPKGEAFELTPDEKAMRDQVLAKENHLIKDEVFNWARIRREAFIAVDGDDRMFSQEYSTTAEESFQTSATTAYPRGIINRLAKRTLNPLWVGEIAFDKASGLPTPYLRATTPQEYIPEPEHENRLHVWERPIREFRYVMGVDVSLGNDGGDYSCVQVIKLTDTIEPDEQVACWRGLIVPEDLAEVVYSIGHWYNEALAAVEVNSMGMVTNSILCRDWEYENVYRYKRMDRLKNFLTDIIGFWTDEKSKRALMSKMSKALHSDSLRIRCEQTVRELYDFTDDYEAASDGAHDDRLMALHIALYCGHEGEVNDRHGSGAKQVGESKANVFEVKDRFGTNIATTTSQPEAERISKKHLGSFTVRNSTSSTTVFIAGKKRRVPADFQNTDFSPIHDGDGTAHRMHYDEGWDEEDITPEAIQEFEQAEAEVEASPDAWMYT